MLVTEILLYELYCQSMEILKGSDFKMTINHFLPKTDIEDLKKGFYFVQITKGECKNCKNNDVIF